MFTIEVDIEVYGTDGGIYNLTGILKTKRIPIDGFSFFIENIWYHLIKTEEIKILCPDPDEYPGIDYLFIDEEKDCCDVDKVLIDYLIKEKGFKLTEEK